MKAASILPRAVPVVLALIASLTAPTSAQDIGVPDKSYKDSSYSCVDYTPLLKGQGNIVEFRCLDGECIKIQGKCNGIKNCKDGSDEGEACEKKTTSSTSTEAQKSTDTREAQKTTTTEAPAATAKHGGQCHTAVQGELCHYKVMWAMHHGIHEHPEWYKGLTAWSNFEDFQDQLWHGSYGNCSRPCKVTTTDAKVTTTTETETTGTTGTTVAATTTTEETSTSTGTQTTTTGVLSIKATLACSTQNVVYMPMDRVGVEGWGMTIEANVSACQARCATTEGCAYFTYYKPLRNCHLEDSDAKPVKHNLLFISGPPDCSAASNEMNFRRKFLSTPGRSMAAQHFPYLSPALTCLVAAVAGTAMTMVALHRFGRERRQALAACTAPDGTQSYASLLRPNSDSAPASAGVLSA